MSDQPESNPPANEGAGMSFTMGGGSLSGNATASYGEAAQPEPAGSPSTDVIKDVTTQTFMADVIEASNERPILVDFWATWCGPCKQLGPIIEKVVAEQKGAVTLCKMDVDKYPEISGQMGIQSIPAVVVFIDGKPADAFMGAKPESEVRKFVEKAVAAKPPAGEAAIQVSLDNAKQMFDAGDFGGAAESYGMILSQEAGNLDALAGLGQCYMAIGETERAQQLVESIPEDHQSSPALAALVQAIELSAQAEGLGELTELRTSADADPKNYQARFDLALALNATGQREEAAEELIKIVKADRTWNDDGAREQLLKFFEAWGNPDPATLSGRRALSSVLFS